MNFDGLETFLFIDGWEESGGGSLEAWACWT